jgi:hypothetical protein
MLHPPLEADPLSHRLVELTVAEPEPAPALALPQGLAQLALGGQQRRERRCCFSGQGGRRAVLDDLPVVDHQHAVEGQRLRDVVGHAEQRGVAPATAGGGEQRVTLGAVEAAEGLVEQDQPGVLPQHRAPEAHALPLPTGDEAAALAERRLKPLRQLGQHVREPGVGEHVGERHLGARAAVAQVLDEGAVPQLYRGIDPGRLAAQLRQLWPLEGLAIDAQLASGGSMPAEQQPRERRLASPGGADHRDVLATTDGEVELLQQRVTAGPDLDVSKLDAGAEGRRGLGAPDRGWRAVDRLLRRRPAPSAAPSPAPLPARRGARAAAARRCAPPDTDGPRPRSVGRGSAG